MCDKLSDYLVLEILSNGQYGETCYRVKHKINKLIKIWKAYDITTYNNIKEINREIDIIKQMDHDNIIKYYQTIKYQQTNTFYIVTELYSTDKLIHFIEKSQNDHLLFNQIFLWKCLYQIASAVKHINKIHIEILQIQLNTNNIYVNDKFDLKIDPFHLSQQQENVTCSSDMCKIGEILYEMCFLRKFAPDLKMDERFNCDEDIHNMLNILLHKHSKQNGCCLLKPDTILHHPTVLINLQYDMKDIFVNKNSQQKILSNHDSAFESDESIHKNDITLRKSLSSDDLAEILSTPKQNFKTYDLLEYKSIPTASQKETYIGNQLSPTLLALDLKIPGYIPRKESEHVKKWTSRLELCKEPQEVSEQALNGVWLKRLADLREREEVLKQKEIELANEKDKCLLKDDSDNLNDICDSMAGITLQPSVVHNVYKNNSIITQTDKKRSNRLSLSDGSVASNGSRTSGGKNRYRRSSSLKTKYKKRKTMNYEDLNSSLSADPGDASMVQTSHKISSDKVPRPKSIHNIQQRRKVHFNNKNNPFAEYDTVSSTVLTFFDIEEKFDASYEVPRQPPPGESLADRIAKFTYLDLEKMTNEKRALLEEIRKTPPKVDRATKPTLRPRVKKHADNLKKFEESTTVNNNQIYHNDLDIQKCLFTNDLYRPASSLSKTSGCSSRSANSRRSLSSISSSTRDDRKGNTPPFNAVCKDERRKPIIVDIDIESEFKLMDENKENVSTPAPKSKKDSKRKSILGFKTPFKFRL